MSDTTSLPTQDLDPSDSDLISYVVRITPHGKFTFEQVAQFIKEEPAIFQYVISQELLPQEHYHIVCSVDSSTTVQDVRDIIRAFITPFWEDPETHKLPRGFGNKQYNLQECANLDLAISYALKEASNFLFDGFTPEYIEERKSQSFAKKSITTFKLEYMQLSEDFQNSDMELRIFMIKLSQLKAKYDHQVNMHAIHQQALSNAIRRDPNVADEEVEKYLYRQ